MSIKFTRKAYLEVWRDNTYISRHRSLIEAGESASRHADEEGSGDYYITIGGPPQSFTELGPNGLPQNVPAGKVYYMARADVTIRFSEGAPINAFPIGAESAVETSAVSAGTSSSLDVEAPVVGADVFANASNVTVPASSFEMPDISFIDGGGDETYDLRQHYLSAIPSGEVVIDIVLESGALPTGVTIDVANEELDFSDSAGSPSVELGISLNVITAPSVVTTFTLVES